MSRQRAAKIISWVFHPLFMPLYAFFIAYTYDHQLLYHERMFEIIVICLVINILAPGVGIWMMYKRKMIKDLDVSDSRQRNTPFSLVLFYYICTYVVFRIKGDLISDALLSMMLAVPLGIFIAMIINRWTKISVHCLGIGGATGALIGLGIAHNIVLVLPISLLILVGGMVAFARIELSAHTPGQAYLGFAVGLVINAFFVANSLYL
jgi:hypothetical protein